MFKFKSTFIRYIYIRTNSRDLGILSDLYGPNLFEIDPNTGERVLISATDKQGNLIYENGNVVYNDKKQVYMSNSRDPYTVQAKKYLSDYGIDIETERLTYIDSNGNVDVEALKADIKERLIRGEHINLREYAKTITYIDSNGE